MTREMMFFLKFAGVSYASTVFFAVGLGVSLAKNKLNLLKLFLIFGVIAVTLCWSYTEEPFPARIMICIVWTSVLWLGFRFGHKITS